MLLIFLYALLSHAVLVLSLGLCALLVFARQFLYVLPTAPVQLSNCATTKSDLSETEQEHHNSVQAEGLVGAVGVPGDHPGPPHCPSQGAQVSCCIPSLLCSQRSCSSQTPRGPHDNSRGEPQLIHSDVKTQVMSLSVTHISTCSLLWRSFISEICTSRKRGTFNNLRKKC